MAEPSAEFHEKMRLFQARYAGKLRAKLDEMDERLQLCGAEPGKAEHPEALYRLLHSLAGSAGTFGFAEIGSQARAIEQQLKDWISTGAVSPQKLALISDVVTTMRKLLPAE